ncbi:HAD family phosphatase [Prevotella sp. KH2C16]|uniref:HAD family hydrolase n=1 Tax=Prevotella sp. KH2C16 TaxID=1855325 RepID=UPI000B89CD1E|nr:HAD-IA family hydrolase [Prevotella sp. KH2C16]
MFQREIQKYLKDHGFGSFAPKVVLFDMDGVLYDSMPNHARAWQEAMAEFGIRFTAGDSYATEGMRGVDTIRIYARKQLGKELSEAEAQRMYDEKTRLFHLMPQTQIFDGVIDLMRQIKAAGLQIGIVTGSGQKPLIKRLTDDFHNFVEPAHIVTAYDIEHGKPAPDPYLKGLEQAGGLNPWEGIVVENAPMGVRAGVAAGIFTVGINSGPLPDSVLAREGADIIFPSIREFSNHWKDLLK